MNRKLLVSLLQKNIHELEMITEGFSEMNEFPKAIIKLAQQKTEDIKAYIQQLADFNSENQVEQNNESSEVKTNSETSVSTIQNDKIEVYNQKDEIIKPTEIIESELKDDFTDSNEIIKVINIQEEKITTIDYGNNSFVEKSTQTFQSRNDVISKVENSISSNLLNRRIDDIKQAINIGDRFRFQRELFNGNGEEMNKILHYINQLATLEEVQSFLQSKYDWDMENETVLDFFQIVRRRFF
jgi:hypothetical protein